VPGNDASASAVDLVVEGTPTVSFFTIRRGERVWQMNDARFGEHLRWENTLWLADRIRSRGLEPNVRRVPADLEVSL
jgi:hypothetical protein